MTDKKYSKPVTPKFNMPKLEIVTPETISAMRMASALWSEQFKSLDRTMAGIRRNLEFDVKPIREALSSLQKSWQPFFAEVTRHNSAKAPLKAAGLLPHKTTPWEQFSEDDPESFPTVVLGYYATNWNDVDQLFRDDVGSYSISESAAGAFHDALACHGNGLFRPSVLTLLPAIEMEFRKAFELKAGAPAASLKELREMVMKVPAGYILSHVAPRKRL